MRHLPFLCLAASLLLPISAQSAVSFQFTYGTGAELWSTEARTALNTAATNMAAYFGAYDAIIDLQVTGTNSGSGTLASAGSEYAGVTGGFGNLGVVGSKILSNGANDLNGAGFDGVVDANFSYAWSYGDSVGASEYDFISTMMHELGHALGFLSALDEAGVSFLGDGAYTAYDQFLVNGAGSPMVTAGFQTSSSWATDSVGGTGTAPATPGTGLYFNGTNAVAANGGNLVPIYSPTSWESGSSVHHLDDNYFTGSNAQMMNATTATGLGIRTLSDIEMAMFRDLGYLSIQTVPEPAKGMLAFLALSCMMLRRRRHPQA